MASTDEPPKKKQKSEEQINNQIAKYYVDIAEKLQQNPNDASIYSELCLSNIKAKSYHKALRFAYMAIKTDPSVAKYWMNYASCWQRLGNDDKAAIAYQTARDLSPNQTGIPRMKQQRKYVREFDGAYRNDMDRLRQDSIDKALKNHEDLRAMMDQRIATHGQNGSVELSMDLVMLATQKPECLDVLTGSVLFTMRMESKYRNNKHIKSLPQVKRVWNLIVERQAVDPRAGMHNTENGGQEPKDPREIDHSFKNGNLVPGKNKSLIQLCNVSRSDGPVMWVNNGHFPVNAHSEWTELNDHWVYGDVTAQQILDVIKRVICGHRVAINGDMKAERPKHIVIQEGLNIDYTIIKKELKKLKIGCFVSSEVPKTFIMGPYDGRLMHV